jgi:Protein of unknown function (DUF2818)
LNSSFSSWFVILLAIIVANLPFLNERLFSVIPIKMVNKPFLFCLVELFIAYGLLGIICFLLESNVGNVFLQGWEFYAVTGCLFIVLAYPGFVFRYLHKSSPIRDAYK